MTLHQAPFGLRMMATIVDLALVLGTVCGLTLFAATELPHFPAIKTAEFLGIAAVILPCACCTTVLSLHRRSNAGHALGANLVVHI